MARIELRTIINAPAETCFDLARDLDLHIRSMTGTDEKAVGGKTTGLIGLGEEVTWEAVHFGITHRHTSKITRFDRPNHFRDKMMKGRFKTFVHDHYFEERSKRTVMRDVVEFSSPLGVLGRLVDSLVLKRYLAGLLRTRAEIIRAVAEGN